MPNPPPTLEQLLRRKDIWRGHSQVFIRDTGVTTGYAPLDQALKDKGWPQGGLIELCSPNYDCDWWLLHPGLIKSTEDGSYMVLVAPPYVPYAPALRQIGIPLEQLLVVTPNSKADLIACMVEFGQSPACRGLLAWQQGFNLSYTELRKIHLACSEQAGLYALFRHQRHIRESSPASLRLSLTLMPDNLQIQIFKQKGKLYSQTINIPLPDFWQALPSHGELTDGTLTEDDHVSEESSHPSRAQSPRRIKTLRHTTLAYPEHTKHGFNPQAVISVNQAKMKRKRLKRHY